MSDENSLFTPITTQAGHAARMAAVVGGFAVDITHIGLGDSGYDVVVDATTGRCVADALRNRIDFVAIQDARTVAPSQKDLSFVVEPTTGYWIREIGFYLADGTLYSVASHPTLSLDWASPSTRNLFALEYVIDDGDADSINIIETGPPLNLLMTKEIAILSTIANRGALETLRLADRIHEITGEY